MARLRTAALNLLRLAGFQSILAGMQAFMQGITVLLAMAITRAQHNACRGFGPAMEVTEVFAGVLVAGTITRKVSGGYRAGALLDRLGTPVYYRIHWGRGLLQRSARSKGRCWRRLHAKMRKFARSALGLLWR